MAKRKRDVCFPVPTMQASRVQKSITSHRPQKTRVMAQENYGTQSSPREHKNTNEACISCFKLQASNFKRQTSQAQPLAAPTYARFPLLSLASSLFPWIDERHMLHPYESTKAMALALEKETLKPVPDFRVWPFLQISCGCSFCQSTCCPPESVLIGRMAPLHTTSVRTGDGWDAMADSPQNLLGGWVWIL